MSKCSSIMIDSHCQHATCSLNCSQPQSSPLTPETPTPIPRRQTRSSTIAPTPQLSATPSLRCLPLTSDSARIEQLEARVADLEDLLAHSEAVQKLAEGQCRSAETHACHAMREAATLCFQLNQQAEKKDGHGRQINVKARIMTSEEGLQMCQEERAVREEKEWQKQEKQSRKDTLNKENLVRWANHSATMVFTGALTINEKNKAELGDITAALGLDMQIDDKQMKAQLFELIRP
ncbi:hypothetical protein H0H87_007483 [Tephrocybe sp. NHM501043]|nr:hypothetical protein H0H87_007483 [Tephrocybe sp. NHM501043]